jgi:hypothetical protein
MWSFISSYNGAISAVANILMLIIWGIYLHLLLNSHLRARRAKILINRSAGTDLGANCVVSNMSEGPVYLECVAVTLRSEGKEEVCSLTDLHDLAKHPDSDPRTHWFQGPLLSGDYISLGSFHDLLHKAIENGRLDLSKIDAFEVLVVAIYGPDAPPVGAARLFKRDGDASDDNCWQAEPSRQLRGFWERRRLRTFLR